MSSINSISKCQILFQLTLMIVAVSSQAYEFPIHQNLPYNQQHRLRQQLVQHQNQHHQLQPQPQHHRTNQFSPDSQTNSLPAESLRRQDDASFTSVSQGSAQDELPTAEAQQLHHLHQVVDTVAQLLNEEEQSSRHNHNSFDSNLQSDESQQLPAQAPELMSEAAIRQAIEELERVQQQERQRSSALVSGTETGASADPQVGNGGGKSTGKQQSNLESLIDELGDELMDDQIAAASQEAERLIRSSGDKNEVSLTTVAPIVTTQKQIATSTANARAQQVTEAPVVTTSSASTTVTSAPLKQTSSGGSVVVGQLDQLDSELGSALTNDFYAFHGADASSNQEKSSPVQVESAPVAREYRSSHNDFNQMQANSQTQNNDLESAAQNTRNTVTQQQSQLQAQQPFDQSSGSNLRFDFSQPQAQPQRPTLEQQEALVRAFRQQTGAASLDPNEFGSQPSGGLIPIASSDGFWRPASQQAASGSSFQQNLPASRFQSLNSLNPSLQGTNLNLNSANRQNIHFSGHSFVSQNNNNNNQAGLDNNRAGVFSSTSAPLISVLSGVEQVSGGAGSAVSWNPPPTGQSISQQPPPQLFSQPFGGSSTPPSAPNQQQFLPANGQPPSQLFRQAFQPVVESNGQPQFQDQRPREQFAAPGDQNNNFNNEPTTEARFQQPSSTQWSPASSPQPANERDASDTQPITSVRALPNGQRFFSPNDLVSPPSSTPQSVTTVPSIPSSSARNFRPQPTEFVETTTPNNFPSSSSSVAPAPIAANTTAKKDDMVIYYYYYYDDNKNATVVAKNVTTGGPVSLDTAIEADGGVEDTPYMDDPAPLNDIRSGSSTPPTPRPQSISSTTLPSTTSTSTTTTSATPSLSTFNTFEANAARAFQPTSSQRPPVDSQRFQPFQPFQSMPQNDQPRPPARQPQPVARPQQPEVRPSSTTARTPVREPTRQFSGSTELPSSQAAPSRQSLQPTVPNARLQNQVIQNALSGSGRAQATPIPVPTPTGNVRTPLSNASRYGTNANSNLMLDQTFGLDPTGIQPTGNEPLHHHGHHQPTSASHPPRSHTNTQAQAPRRQPQPAEPQFVSNPSPVPEDFSRGNPQSTRGQTGGNFSAQRNQNQRQPLNAPPAPQVAPVTGNRLPVSTSAPAGSRQFFPEANEQPTLVSSTSRATQPKLAQSTPRQPTSSTTMTSMTSRQQSPSSSTTLPSTESLPSSSSTRQSQPSTSSFSEDDLGADLDQPRATSARTSQMNNGRPSTPEGNTSNAFTRSPLQVSTSTTSAPRPAPIQRQPSTEFERPQAQPLPASIQPVSTPATRPSTTSQQVSTSASPLPASSTSAQASQSVSSSSTTAQTTTPAPQTTSAPTVTTASQETSSEAPADANSIAAAAGRRRFGNRNNRFQTRLTATAGNRASTTSTTTPSPSSSSTTTRRPATSSTTRKSSRQLFSGRRRLGSTESPSASGSPVASASNTTLSQPLSESSGSSQSSVRSGSGRFGNSFTANRSRSTTTAPPSSDSNAANKPASSLFSSGNQRATFKPRLPFMRKQTNAAEAPVPETTPVSVSMTSSTSSTSSSSIMSSGPAIQAADSGPASPSSVSVSVQDRPSDMMSNSNTMGEETSTGSGDDSSMTSSMAEDSASESSDNTNKDNQTSTTTEAPSSTSAPTIVSDRNKPKVRPLFASRQRNMSLFGNRRSGNSTAT